MQIVGAGLFAIVSEEVVHVFNQGDCHNNGRSAHADEEHGDEHVGQSADDQIQH